MAVVSTQQAQHRLERGSFSSFGGKDSSEVVNHDRNWQGSEDFFDFGLLAEICVELKVPA